MGGALLGNLLTTIDPKMFTFLLTFNVLMIVVAGGLGSLTGSILGSAVITVLLEWLRAVEEPITLGGFAIPRHPPACAWSCSSLVLLCIILYRREGIMGMREITLGRHLRLLLPEETRMTSFAQNGLLLDVQHVTMRFGGITAVNDLSMRIPTGSITGLIGPNGAGKTTASTSSAASTTPRKATSCSRATA